ncbi:hypothetical protein IEQ34_014898 [Dendrobium chrysotoxum]|uniref:Uncharacterized protein n=1 Tax=Dendrobium chrysotoxum TaxID=161865 RepID=A0AAV7GKF8_DENCH|nr:hypothetical protein IEQ34_014898 [Dendrobium chrysotoxum]
MSSSSAPTTSPSTEHEILLEKLEVFKVQDRGDKRGRKILRIIGKFFPGKFLSQSIVFHGFDL